MHYQIYCRCYMVNVCIQYCTSMMTFYCLFSRVSGECLYTILYLNILLFVFSVGYFIEPTILQSTDPKEKILKEVCLIKPIQLSFSFNSLDSSLHFLYFILYTICQQRHALKKIILVRKISRRTIQGR